MSHDHADAQAILAVEVGPDGGETVHHALPERNAGELAIRFTYHAPHGDQAERYVTIRDLAHALATLISTSTPDCREQRLAFTALEEAVFWANAAIARRES